MSLRKRHFICTSTCQTTQRLTYGASWQDAFVFSWFCLVFVLPSIFLDLLVARSVSWQETLYMYKYISTYTASLDKRRFFLLLYLYTWCIRSLLTRRLFFLGLLFLCVLSYFLGKRHFICRSTYQPTQRLLTRYASFCFVIYILGTYGASWQDTFVFSLFCLVFVLPSIFLDLLVARSVSSQETLYMYKYMSDYTASYIRSLLTRHVCLLMVLFSVRSSFHLSRSTRCTKCLFARDTLYVQVHVRLRSVLHTEPPDKTRLSSHGFV